MLNNDLNNYLRALKSKSKNIKEVEMASSDRKKTWVSQQGRCAVCKKDLKSYYCKYIKDQKTNLLKVVCSDCAIKTIKKN